MHLRPALLALLTVPLLLGGCVRYSIRNDGITRASFGETVVVDGPKVTPLSLVEDSRCPASVQCISAGRVRVSLRIDLGAGSETRDFTLGEPQQVADGTMTLVEVMPLRRDVVTLYPEDYRFGFTFAGGL
jgi:hypothetical protein